MKEIEKDNVKIQYDDGNVRILDSYRITEMVEMYNILSWFLYKTGYRSRRNIFSWMKEWKAHNRLYKLGLFKEHTKDCDLEENEKWYRLLLYEIIGF